MGSWNRSPVHVFLHGMNIGIAMGSNLGESREEVFLAMEYLRKLDPGIRCSSLYASSPVDCPEGSPEFINAVVEIEFGDGVMYLLSLLQKYESGRGRPEQRSRNVPRPIDLDILYAGPLEMNTGRLVLPHPRLGERLFVLEPLAEINPELLLPGREKKVSELLEELKRSSHDQVCRKIE